MGSLPAEVTNDCRKAAKLAAEGSPVVLVASGPAMLAGALAASADRGGRERFLAVMVGDLADPSVAAAAAEMAAELWPWAERAPAPPASPAVT